MEAAVILSRSLVDSSSFTELLDRFEGPEDRENVRHRVQAEKGKLLRR